MLPALAGETPLLRSSSTGVAFTPAQAFAGVAGANEEMFDGLVPAGEPRLVEVSNQYPVDDYVVVETPAGSVAIKAIVFTGELRIKEKKLPIVNTADYRDASTGASISQVVTFAGQSIMGCKFAVELQRHAESGETHVTLRRLPNDA